MHDQTRVVIIGSGIAGSSIAYHMTERGWRDIVVLEQGPLIGGTTSHAPGLVGQLRSYVSLTKMLVYSVALYKTLQVDGQALAPGGRGGGSGFFGSGGFGYVHVGGVSRNSAHKKTVVARPCAHLRTRTGRSSIPEAYPPPPAISG